MSGPESPRRPAAFFLPRDVLSWTVATLTGGLAIGLVMGAFSYFMQRWIEPSIVTLPIGQFPWIAAFNVLAWTTWLALVPLMLWLARRVRFRRERIPRAAVVHGAASLAISALHCVIAGAIMFELLYISGYAATVKPPLVRPTLLGTVQRQFLYAYEWEVLLYACVVATSHALWLRNEVRARELEEARLQSRLVEARLEALQRQLHPHFLFNTLNTVAALLRQDPRGAEAMIVRLGDLLRVVFRSHAHQHVRLAREIELTEQYLAIQRIRFGGFLAFTSEVSGDAADALVPVLLLQPIVENSVKHGFARRGGRGTIHVSATRRGESLAIVVSDDGAGAETTDFREADEGVGLANMRVRLEHLYPSAHAVRFESEPQRGFRVHVELPWTVDPAADEIERSGVP
jgi:two-component system LytT family sensor kinase